MFPREPFDETRPVIGMVHLPALPGSPAFDGDRDAILERALADAEALAAGGVDAVLVENYGDAPLYPDSVPSHVVAELTAVTSAVTDAVDVPVGVNVLRNDVEAALSVAAACGGSFVRANVHVGAAVTDQGVVEGAAHETVRHRDRIEAPVAILADVDVKHATAVDGRPPDLGRATRETIGRGLADGVVVSGSATGERTAVDDVRRVVEIVDALGGRHTGGDDRSDGERRSGGERRSDGERRSSGESSGGESAPPVLVGSGVTPESVGDYAAAGADGLIVGTALKDGGETTNPVSTERVQELVEAAAAAGFE